MGHLSNSRSVLSGSESLSGRAFYLIFVLVPLLSCPLVWAQASTGSNQVEKVGADVMAQGRSEARELEPGKAFERQINSGETHSYLVKCDAGQFMQIDLEQRGINVGVDLFGVDKKLILSLNNIDDPQGTERMPLLADVAGVYRLEVKSLGRNVDTGRYGISVSQARAATQQDRDFMAAEKLILEARRFVGRGTGLSKREALSKYREALPLLRSSGNHERAATVLNNIGLFYRTLGELNNALDFYTQALALRRQIGDRRGEAISLDNLGYIYVELGEMQKGLDLYEQSLTLERADKSLRLEAVTLTNIGSVYFALGETERALDFYSRALPLFKALGGRPREALTLTSMGAIYFSRGEHKKALEFYDRALAVQQELNVRSSIASTRMQLGILYAKQGENKKAFDFLNQALEFARKTGNRFTEGEVLAVIGEVYYEAGEKKKAFEHFKLALPLRQESFDKTGEARTLYWIARSERDRGELPKALTDIEAALRIVETVRGRIASQTSRTSYFSTVQKYYDFYIDLLFELHQENPAAAFDQRSFQASENARARGLVDLLRESRADIRRGADPALLERERSLQQQLSARTQEQSLILRGEHTNEQAEILSRELDALTNEYDEVQTRMRKRSPRYAALMQPTALTLQEIQQSLDKETLLLEYKLGETRSFVWAVTPSTINIYELPGRAEVEKMARRFYEALTARNEHPEGESVEHRLIRLSEADADNAKLATQMSQMVLAPVRSHLKAQRLFIVSDGALQYVPFSALPELDAAGNKTNGKKRVVNLVKDSQPLPLIPQPLIADHEIISLASASVITVLRKELSGRRSAPKAIAVLADPVFDRDDVRVKLPANNNRVTPAVLRPQSSSAGMKVAAKESFSMMRLPFSRREAQSILAAIPASEGMSAFDFQASRATATSQELAQYRILHFATHGVLDSQRPELSAIVLSLVDERGEPQNGFLRLNEIYNLNLPADLVMLSACQTGLGKEIRGEGLVGLTRGFMYAGAARVGTSLWKVDDSATAALMGRFYQAMLKERKSPAAALRIAQLDMLKQKRWHSPYFWAAFTMQGEWK